MWACSLQGTNAFMLCWQHQQFNDTVYCWKYIQIGLQRKKNVRQLWGCHHRLALHSISSIYLGCLTLITSLCCIIPCQNFDLITEAEEKKNHEIGSYMFVYLKFGSEAHPKTRMSSITLFIRLVFALCSSRPNHSLIARDIIIHKTTAYCKTTSRPTYPLIRSNFKLIFQHSCHWCFWNFKNQWEPPDVYFSRHLFIFNAGLM